MGESRVGRTLRKYNAEVTRGTAHAATAGPLYWRARGALTRMQPYAGDAQLSYFLLRTIGRCVSDVPRSVWRTYAELSSALVSSAEDALSTTSSAAFESAAFYIHAIEELHRAHAAEFARLDTMLRRLVSKLVVYQFPLDTRANMLREDAKTVQTIVVLSRELAEELVGVFWG